MLITDAKQGWDSKVNFTDSNDVFVGFDSAQDCCEEAGYFISKSADSKYNYNGNESFSNDVEGYVFDIEFFQEVESPDLDEGGQVCFRLIKEGCCDLFLHLYNSHNGYYWHGFEAKIKGQEWQKGEL